MKKAKLIKSTLEEETQDMVKAMQYPHYVDTYRIGMLKGEDAIEYTLVTEANDLDNTGVIIKRTFMKEEWKEREMKEFTADVEMVLNSHFNRDNTL